MYEIKFVWDKNKELINRRKHGITFEEAKTIFYDENARLIYDPDHSETEDRFILIGLSNKLKVLVVCHCYRKNAEIIRIISVRKATKKEAKEYWRNIK